MPIAAAVSAAAAADSSAEGADAAAVWKDCIEKVDATSRFRGFVADHLPVPQPRQCELVAQRFDNKVEVRLGGSDEKVSFQEKR